MEKKWEASSINSMTGYGRCVRAREGRSLTVELKSVNHRFLDVSLRMPRCFLFLEDEARKAIGRRLSRGHVDVFCTYRNQREDARGVQVDEGLIRAYLRATDALAGLADDRSVMGVLSLPEVVQVVEAEEDREALRALLLETLEGALDEVAAMRAVEGEALRKDIESPRRRAGNDRPRHRRARAADAHRLPRAPARQRGRAARRPDGRSPPCAGSGDHGRPPGHRRGAGAPSEPRRPAARPALPTPPPPGGGWTFLAQEFNREVNTIASKSQDIEITRLAMDGKAEIEKLREQVQNVE